MLWLLIVSRRHSLPGPEKEMRIYLVAILILLLLSNSAFAFEYMKADWIAYYDGSAGDYDAIKDMAVDADGNVFVTGFVQEESRDYITIKYDTNGYLLWSATYDGPVMGLEQTKSLAIDNLGNVFVTGYSDGIDSDLDIATIKYDSDGDEVFAVRYNGPGNDLEAGYEIVTDDSGNSYVCGRSHRDNTDPSINDGILIKYDSLGNELWADRFSIEEKEMVDASFFFMSLSSDGHVFVAGAIGYFNEIDERNSSNIGNWNLWNSYIIYIW